MANVKISNLNKKYPNGFHAVKDVNLEIIDKEFMILVGPSGCGKTTTLRMIAGLEEITSGDMQIGDEIVNDVSPKDRNIAMVFQNYALYPHMSVYENMAFGLRLKKLPKEEIDRRVHESAKILEIEQYLDRKPKALSGGQRQRVALGRAIVRNAQVFLMDEPLSNLDAKLRVQMRSEIIKLHERLNATTIYVTHDRTEAMTMATRIVVMKDGYIQQIGTPKEIYNHPNNMFVANFVGAPAMNFINGKFVKGRFEVDGQSFMVPNMFHDQLKNYEGEDLVSGIRPEDIHYEGIVAATFPDTPFAFTIDVSELLGHEFILHGQFGGQKLLAKVASRVDVKAHDTIKLAMDVSKLHFFDKETTKAIF